MKRSVYLLYCLSGLVSLGYQVAWFRIFVDRFGSTNLTFALVVCSFIGGIGIGAVLSKRLMGLTSRITKGSLSTLQIYGLIELLIAATVGLTIVTGLIPGDLVGEFPFTLDDAVYRPTRGYQLVQVGIASGCVFVPCLLMGVTFPLLCRVFDADSKFPSALYAFNTLGAATGILLCEFFFLPTIGHDRTLVVMMGLNATIGIIFLSRRRPASEQVTPVSKPSRDAMPPSRAPVSTLVGCAILSGFLCGALEGDLIRRIWFLGLDYGAVMSFISFWAILGIFLSSWYVRRATRLRLVHIQIAYVVAALTYIGLWVIGYRVLFFFGLRPVGQVFGMETALIDLLLCVGVFVFPAYFLASLLLPYVCNRLQAQRRHIGLAYGLNTVFFCLGVVAFTMLAPLVNIFFSLKLFLVVFVVLAVWLLLVREDRPMGWGRPIVLGAAIVSAILIAPRGFDPEFFRPGSAPRKYPVRAMKSNAAHTTFVVEEPGGSTLYFDSHAMSGVGPGSQRYMRLFAHFPLLAHPDPESVLVICFGVGNTASAVAAHETIERIDIVDLNDKVFETADEFAQYNRRVHRDPRVRLIHDDGRSFLARTKQSYDLITSEPPPPLQAGVYRLYSREYYLTASARLNPGGMMTQWIPLTQMSPESVDMAVSAFISVFPHALLLVGHDTELILVGSAEPIDIANLEQAATRSSAVQHDLASIGIGEPIEMVARIICGTESLRERYGHVRVISDQRNDLAYQLVSSEKLAVVAYDPFRMLDEIDASRLAMYERLRRTVTNLVLLRATVQDFPQESLMTVRDAAGPGVLFADVDWLEAERLFLEAAREVGDRPQEAERLLEESLTIVEDPVALFRLAQVETRLGQTMSAAARWRRLAELRTRDPRPLANAAALYADAGRLDEAVQAYDEAIERAPNDTALKSRRERVVRRSEGRE